MLTAVLAYLAGMFSMFALLVFLGRMVSRMEARNDVQKIKMAETIATKTETSA